MSPTKMLNNDTLQHVMLSSTSMLYYSYLKNDSVISLKIPPQNQSFYITLHSSLHSFLSLETFLTFLFSKQMVWLYIYAKRERAV